VPGSASAFAASATQAPAEKIHRRIDVAVQPVRRLRLFAEGRPRRQHAEVGYTCIESVL